MAPAGSRQLAQGEPQRHHNDRHTMLQQTHFSWKRISVEQAKTTNYVGMCARESCIRVGFEWIICLNLFQAVQIIADVRIRDPWNEWSHLFSRDCLSESFHYSFARDVRNLPSLTAFPIRIHHTANIYEIMRQPHYILFSFVLWFWLRRASPQSSISHSFLPF